MAWSEVPDNEFVTWFPRMPNDFEGDQLVNALRLKGGQENLPEFPRWLCFGTSGQVDLVSVPWAWWGTERADDDEIRFLYDRVRSSSASRKSRGYLNLSLQDHRWFGLIEFLASDRLSRASEAFDAFLRADLPELALYGKVQKPLTAVAGGIVLITQAKNTERQEWDNWLENLSNWFPGIPDGPILLGCRQVQSASNIDDLTVAFNNLHEGYARGIPFFSASIRMLDMALAQIGSDISDADKYRREISFVLSRVDPGQPSTVIRL